MMLPTGERSGVVVEPFLTNQWFVDSKKIMRSNFNHDKKK